MPTSSVDLALEGAPRTPRFRFVRPVGRGTTGVVYEAIDTATGQARAVKVARSSGPWARTLALEFELRARVEHPGLVAMYDFVDDGEHSLLVMELLRGVTFVEHCRHEPPVSSRWGPPVVTGGARPPWGGDEIALRDAFGQLADTLASMHRAGCVHCDIKNTNVLVTGDGRVRIIDLGLAIDAHSASARSPQERGAGTPAYLAPEVSAGAHPSPASDWYAAGVLLYLSLTGHLPFEGDAGPLLLAKRTLAPLSPHAWVTGAPDDLVALAQRLLATTPADRPAGHEVLVALGRIAHAPTPPAR